MLVGWLVACGGAPADTYQVAWSFANIEEGYDHQHRVDVFVDGQKVAESRVAAESVPGELVFPVPPGFHEVRVVDMTLYEGNWEAHTVENNYSIDCEWKGKVEPGGSLVLRFDIDQGTVVLTQKK